MWIIKFNVKTHPSISAAGQSYRTSKSIGVLIFWDKRTLKRLSNEFNQPNAASFRR